MLSLHTNASALSTQKSLTNTNFALSSSMTKLGTGYRVNSAMDDAAGLQIATRLNAQTRGMQVAQKNTQNGISMLQTAEGALSEIGNIMLRMKDLATEGATATASDADRKAMQTEFTALTNEITNILTNTKFGGQPLLGSAGSFKPEGEVVFHIGASEGEQYELAMSKYEIDVTKLGSLADAGASKAAIGFLDTAIASVGTVRSELGGAANRLQHTYNNLGNMIQNTEAAKGRIMDVDFAKESSNMVKNQMLMQTSTAMLKQSNSLSQMVGSLVQ